MFTLHFIPDRFYRFYDKWDVVKGTILLIVLHVLMTPFIIWAVYFIIWGPSYFLAVILSGISLINIGYYIKAVVCFIIYSKKMKYLKENNLLPDQNVDPIWTINRH